MENKYAVLSYPGDPLQLLWSDILQKLTGVHALISDVASAVTWARWNTKWVLIVSMPIDEEQRQSIANNLRDIEPQCIALDPAILKVGSRPLFRATQQVTWSVFIQIKWLVADGIKKD